MFFAILMILDINWNIFFTPFSAVMSDYYIIDNANKSLEMKMNTLTP